MQGNRITRSRTDRMIAGIAGGLGARFNIDPVLVRLAFVALTLLNGFGVLLYLILWLLLPSEDSSALDTRSQVQENLHEMQSAAEHLVDRVRGTFQR